MTFPLTASKTKNRKSPKRRGILAILAVLLFTPLLRGDDGLRIPTIAGGWATLVEMPELHKLAGTEQRLSGFCLWQAGDGAWQVWSALGDAKEAGRSGSFFRWESPSLVGGKWTPRGVVLRADDKPGASLQSPFVFKDGDAFRLFHGDGQGICSATSADGKEFRRDGIAEGLPVQFDRGTAGRVRDPFVTKIGPLWHCYYSAETTKTITKDGKTTTSNEGAVYCRTSPDLKTWGAEKRVAFGGQSGDGIDSATCPRVIESGPGHFFLLRTQSFGKDAKTSVYHSTDPLDFGIQGSNGDALHFVTTLPVAAPELVRVDGQWFIAALRADLRGIQIAKLDWREIATPARPAKRPDGIAIRVALYDDSGSMGKGVPSVSAQLGRAKDIEVTKLDGAGIRAGLDGYDVVIFTGGSGSRQAGTIGLLGREQVRRFVEAGGGYVGICAGAYLACDGFSWGIKVLDAKTPSSKWQRGRAELKIETTEAGRKAMGIPAEANVIYHNGPLLVPANNPRIPDYEALTFFRTEVAGFGSPPGIMVNTPAIARGTYGKGRVIVSSPHPEQTPGLEGWIENTVRAVVEK